MRAGPESDGAPRVASSEASSRMLGSLMSLASKPSEGDDAGGELAPRERKLRSRADRLLASRMCCAEASRGAGCSAEDASNDSRSCFAALQRRRLARWLRLAVGPVSGCASLSGLLVLLDGAAKASTALSGERGVESCSFFGGSPEKRRALFACAGDGSGDCMPSSGDQRGLAAASMGSLFCRGGLKDGGVAMLERIVCASAEGVHNAGRGISGCLEGEGLLNWDGDGGLHATAHSGAWVD
jgi:hypothetical protein